MPTEQSTTEIWKDVVGYEPFYEVSNLGNVRRKVGWYAGHSDSFRKPTGNHKPFPNSDGYLRLTLSVNRKRKEWLVHKLVTAAFLEPRQKGLTVNHKDGNKANNTADNLEYCTFSQNTKHAHEHGFVKSKGEDNGNSKLVKEEVLEIRRMFSEGMAQNELAKTYHVTPQNIHRIVEYRSWKHL